jgi:hypothetical protein
VHRSGYVVFYFAQHSFKQSCCYNSLTREPSPISFLQFYVLLRRRSRLQLTSPIRHQTGDQRKDTGNDAPLISEKFVQRAVHAELYDDSREIVLWLTL